MIELIDKLKERLLQPLPGREAQFKMAPDGRNKNYPIPDDARESGVMILLFEIDKKWNTILIRRTVDGGMHSGQISFPGGKKERTDRDISHTASRECEEEIGVRMRDIEIIGTLTPLYIPPSNFIVTPSIGYVNTLQNYKASEREVEEIIQLPLELLFDDRLKKEKVVTSNREHNMEIKTPVYELSDDTFIWGATAMMISELEHLLNEL